MISSSCGCYCYFPLVVLYVQGAYVYVSCSIKHVVQFRYNQQKGRERERLNSFVCVWPTIYTVNTSTSILTFEGTPTIKNNFEKVVLFII